MRRRYLVAPLQLKYVGLILAISFGVAALCAYVVYYSSMVTMGEKLARVYPQGMLVRIVNTVNLRILMSLIMVSPLIAIAGILLSHRIAGPLVRMEGFIKGMATGDFSSRLTLRKKDELRNLANYLNILSEKMKKDAREEKEAINALLGEIGSLRSLASSQIIDKNRVNASLSHIEESIKRINSRIAQYKM